MLTKRQNLLETIRGGKPVVNQWGVTISFPEDSQHRDDKRSR